MGFGQGTVEYALVMTAVFVVLIAFSLFVRFVSEGNAAGIVVDALSHRLPVGVLDVRLF